MKPLTCEEYRERAGVKAVHCRKCHHDIDWGYGPTVALYGEHYNPFLEWDESADVCCRVWAAVVNRTGGGGWIQSNIPLCIDWG